jgi:hypothetical protein
MRMRTPTWDAAVLGARRLVARAQKCRAYQFCDGFDNYNSASALYDTTNGSTSFSTSYRRFAPPAGLPGQGIKFAPGLSSWILKNLKSNQPTLIIKVAVNFLTLPTTGGGGFMQLADNGSDQVTLCLNPNGSLALYRGRGISGTLLVTSSPGIITGGQWYGIEMEVTINSSTGSASVWVNGIQVINATGLNTSGDDNAYTNQIGIGDFNNVFGSGVYMDDFRVWDATGSTQNAPLGVDSQLVTKLPSGAGASTGWTPNGAAANWQCVDDNPPDGDTTYVSSSAASTADAYAMPSAGFTAAPYMVVARSYVRNAGGSPTMQIGVSSSGTTGGGTAFAPTGSYAFADTCIALDPHTSAAWTAAGADAAQHWKNEVT